MFIRNSFLTFVLFLGTFYQIFAQIPPQMAFNETANRLPVTAGLSLWFDAFDVGSIIRDANNRVTLWQDKSGNNNHAVQNTTAKTLRYVPSYQAYVSSIGAGTQYQRFPALVFDVTNVSASSSNRQHMLGTKQGTYQTIIALRSVITNQTAPQNLFCAPQNGVFSLKFNSAFNSTTNGYYGQYSFSGPVWTSASTANSGSGDVNDWAGVNGIYRVNGVNQGYAGPDTWNPRIVAAFSASAVTDTFSIGSDNASTIRNHAAIFELIVYNRQLSTAEIAQVEQYLARKWRISLTPALNIP